MSKELIDAFTSIQEEDVVKIVNRMLEDGTDPMDVIEVCKNAVRIIGDRFEAGEVFIPELIMAGEIMARISAEVKPLLKTDREKMSKGKIPFNVKMRGKSCNATGLATKMAGGPKFKLRKRL